MHRSACWWRLFHVSTWPALASVEITKKSVFLSTTSQPGPLELQAHYGLALFIPALQSLLLEGKLFEDCHSLAPLTDTKSPYDTQMITRQCSPHISSTVWEVPFGWNICFIDSWKQQRHMPLFSNNFINNFKSKLFRAGDMAQQLRMLAALPGVPRIIPNNHMVGSQLSIMGSDDLF